MEWAEHEWESQAFARFCRGASYLSNALLPLASKIGARRGHPPQLQVYIHIPIVVPPTLHRLCPSPEFE